MNDTWHGSPRKVIGNTQVCLFEMTYGKGRLGVGRKDSLCYDKGY